LKKFFIMLLSFLLLATCLSCSKNISTSSDSALTIVSSAPSKVSNSSESILSQVNSDETEPTDATIKLSEFVKIFTDGGSSYGLTDDGILYAWGYNSRGCLGLPTEDEIVNEPTKINIPEKVVDLAPGALCVALCESGNVYTWGLTELPKSSSTFNYDSTPMQKDLPEAISEIFQAHGMVGLAKGISGELYIWGWNEQGQLFGTTDETWSSVPITAQLPAEAIMVCGYDTHLIALCTDGKIYTWGSNYYGELGDGLTVKGLDENGELIENNRSYAAAVALEGTVISVAAGRGASYALLDDGTVYAWGANDVGQLGVDETVTSSSVPVKIDLPEKITRIISNAFTAYAISESGNLYGWGKNNNGNSDSDYTSLGIGTNPAIVYTPVEIPVSGDVISVQAGFATFALTSDEHLWVWGSNLYNSISSNVEDFPEAPIMLY